jgi:DNA-binding NarL/FixJ family response regulator
MRTLLRRLLSGVPGVEVVTEAGDGKAALGEAAAHQPDLVVLDMVMPVLSGMQALPLLRQVAPASRVVVLTSEPPARGAAAALAAGAAAYVEKGGNPGHLVQDILSGAGLVDAVVEVLHPRAHQSFAATTQAPSQARAFARSTLQQWADADTVDTVELLLSELVTNAVVHANSSPDVALRLLPDRLHVAVTDRMQLDLDRPPADDDAESGRGLSLVEALASSWGTVPVDDGKIVWFDVPRVGVS